MNRIDLDAYLADFADTVTDDQKDEIIALADTIEKVYPGEDYVGERESMLTGVVQAVLGDTDTKTVIRAWREAQARLDSALAEMRGVIAVEVGRTSEYAVHKATGLARATVAKAVGK